MSSHLLFRAKRLQCGSCGQIVSEQDHEVNYVFFDYSWPCPHCAERYCSMCSYELIGDTVIAYACPRFRD